MVLPHLMPLVAIRGVTKPLLSTHTSWRPAQRVLALITLEQKYRNRPPDHCQVLLKHL